MNERKQQVALAVIRIVLGVIFFLHGMQKVFGAFGGSGLGTFADYMAGVTSVMPELTAYAVAFGELLAGAALLIGSMPGAQPDPRRPYCVPQGISA